MLSDHVLSLLLLAMSDDDSLHVSRHFLDRQAQRVRFVPFAEAGPAENAAPGTMLAHRLFVTGGWRQELKVWPDNPTRQPLDC